MNHRIKKFMVSGIAALLLGAIVLPPSFSFAAYATYPGQSVLVQKSNGNAPLVTLQLALVDSVNGLSLTASAYGMPYTVDISAAQVFDKNGNTMSAQALAAGDRINVQGVLDVNTYIVRAQIIRVPSKAGTAPPPPPATGPCASGGQDGASGGWEEPFGEAVVGLVRQAMGCPSIWELKPPTGLAAGTVVPPSGTSPNHKFLWYTWYYGWAMRAGTEAQKTDARAKLVAFFDDQKTNGHYTLSSGASEILNASHYQIWANAATGARFLAFHYNDSALLQATGRWWRAEKALWDVLQQNGSIRAPGGRFHQGQLPVSQLRDTIYGLVTGRQLYVNPGGGGPGVATSEWWNDYYNVSAWTLRNLLAKGDTLGGAATAGSADLPKLPYVMCLYRKGGDYVYSFPKVANTFEPLFWVASIGSQKTNSPYISGASQTSPVPAPALPGSTLTVLAGATGSPSDCPPPPTGSDTTTPSSTPDGTSNSDKAHDLISDLFQLRKNTKAAGFSRNPIDKPKILLNLAKMQIKIIELFVEVKKFPNQTDITKTMALLQTQFGPFNTIAIWCSTSGPFGGYVPFVHVKEICKTGLEKEGGRFNELLDKLKALLPPPPPGTGTGSNDDTGGDGLKPTGPFDE